MRLRMASWLPFISHYQILGARDLKQLAMRDLAKEEIQRLNEALKKRTVTVKVMHRSTGKTRHKVHSFTDKSARRSEFELRDDGTKTTVEKYFK